eukprot:gene13199-13330_t
MATSMFMLCCALLAWGRSDGAQPHLVNIQFSKRMELKELHIYLDYKADESYTPSRLAIRAGSTCHNLKDVCMVELREPIGWTKVAVLANHQNGRDTHIRQVLLYGPAFPSGTSSSSLGCSGQFDTLEFSCYSVIR